MMSQFDYLLIGHLIGDFLLQTSWMAQYKATKWFPLLTHVSIYTLVIALFGFLSGGLSLVGLAIIFIGHIILDRKTFVTFWVKKIQMVKRPHETWLSIVADQIFHLILLAIAIAIS
jgi:nicotinamide riboside transporter PnuC